MSCSVRGNGNAYDGIVTQTNMGQSKSLSCLGIPSFVYVEHANDRCGLADLVAHNGPATLIRTVQPSTYFLPNR